jgi:hypothetical protein
MHDYSRMRIFIFFRTTHPNVVFVHGSILKSTGQVLSRLAIRRTDYLNRLRLNEDARNDEDELLVSILGTYGYSFKIVDFPCQSRSQAHREVIRLYEFYAKRQRKCDTWIRYRNTTKEDDQKWAREFIAKQRAEQKRKNTVPFKVVKSKTEVRFD